MKAGKRTAVANNPTLDLGIVLCYTACIVKQRSETMFANTKIVRKFARYINGEGFGYAGTFTDKVVKEEGKDNGERYVAFRLYGKAEADKLAKELEVMLFVAGYTNKVKRTSSESNWANRTGGGEYVRVKALVG